MKGQLIDVLIEADDGKVSTNLAKIVEQCDDDKTYKIKYLFETSKTYEDVPVYKFEKKVSEINVDSVDGYYDTTDIEIAGYTKIDGVGYVSKEDLDEDYDPSESDDDDEEDELSDLEDEDEEEEQN